MFHVKHHYPRTASPPSGLIESRICLVGPFAWSFDSRLFPPGAARHLFAAAHRLPCPPRRAHLATHSPPHTARRAHPAAHSLPRRAPPRRAPPTRRAHPAVHDPSCTACRAHSVPLTPSCTACCTPLVTHSPHSQPSVHSRRTHTSPSPAVPTPQSQDYPRIQPSTRRWSYDPTHLRTNDNGRAPKRPPIECFT